MRGIAAAGVALVFAACGGASGPEADTETTYASMEASAEMAAEKLQGLGEEFAVVEVAARAQSAFRLSRDDARLMIVASDPSDTPVLDETFYLRADEGIESRYLRDQRKDGYDMITYGLAPEDSTRILEVRQQLAALKAAAPGENKLSIDAYVTGCLKDGYETPDALRLTFFLRIRPNEDFFPLFNEMALPNTGQDFQSGFWTPCGEKRGT